MTTPRVTELPPRLEPVLPDPFIEAPPGIAIAAPRVAEGAEEDARNGSGAGGTQRA